MYFTIHCSEDGDVRVHQDSKEELLQKITEHYYGDSEFFSSLQGTDPQEWGDKLLIIKGEIVVPKPKKIIEKYEIK